MAVNYFAVFAAALAAFVIGWAWYSPALFGRAWMRSRGVDPATMGDAPLSARSMTLQFLASLIMAYVLAVLLSALGVGSIGMALELGFFVWIGFLATTSIGSVLWEGRPWMYWGIVASNMFVTTLSMATILSLWR